MTVVSSTFQLPNFPIDPRTVTAPGGGRLKYFVDNWECIDASPFVINIIKYGYKIQFVEPPPLVIAPKPFSLHLPPDQQKILDQELNEFLINNVIRPADINTPGYYSPVFLREKPRHNLSDPVKYRVIIDLSSLNHYVVKKHFKMESTNSIRNILNVGDHFFTLDLTMAYNTIPMHQSSTKYLRFWWNNTAYEFTALCFGLTSAPWLFSLVMAEMSKYLHKHGISCIFYLDDLLFKDLDYHVLQINHPHIILFIQSLGWLINMEKSQLDIVQRGVYVGTDYDLVAGMVFPPQDRWVKLQLKLQPFFSIHTATAHQWSSLLGTITSCQELAPLGRLMARDLQIHVNSHWTDRTNLRTQIPVTQEIQSRLLWWTKVDNVMCGHQLRPPPHAVEIWSDASHIGWGAHILEKHSNLTDEVSGSWTSVETLNHINYLELRAVFLALQHWIHLVTNQSVLVHTDNTSALSYINRQSGSRSPTLHQLCQKLLVWCHQRNIVLRAAHIKGSLNTHSDYLSRKGSIITTEWSIHPSILHRINLTWPDKPQIDLFATKLNNKLPLYVSPMPDPCALGTDALTMNWDGFLAYAYPPQSVIPQVLNKIQQHQCIVYLIAPNWPRLAWFPLMLTLLVDYPREIPVFPKLLRQPGTSIFHPNPNNLKLHVFKLSTNPSLQEDFLLKLQRTSVKRTDNLLMPVTNAIGPDGYVGVKKNLLIPSWQL